MKKSTLIKLHVYCGLFTAFYILAFGVSSIILNHQMEVDNTDVTKTWQGEVSVTASMSQQEMAEDFRNQLDLMGWVPPWRYQKDSTHFQFETTHLAKTCAIKVNLLSGATEVKEMPKGFWAVFHGLHFFNGSIPNAPFFLKTWMVYQWLGLFVLFLSLILGIWLWLKFSYKTWELYAFGGLFLLSIILMIMI